MATSQTCWTSCLDPNPWGPVRPSTPGTGGHRPTTGPGGPAPPPPLLGRGQSAEQLAHVGALLEEGAHLGTGAALGLEDRDALEAGAAGDVEDDRVPARGEDLRGEAAHALAAEPGAGVL